MQQNLESTYKEELDRLIAQGGRLELAMNHECYPERIETALGKKAKKLPNFRSEYQTWYSEAKALIRQLLPDRLADFTRHYEKPKPRKDITFENYRIEDFLQGLSVTRSYDQHEVAGPSAAIPHFQQQLAIVNAVSSRFESSLYDIRQLVQADLFDSELAAAAELLKRGFVRASGAVAGVVLEKHLGQVMENHSVTTRKKHRHGAKFSAWEILGTFAITTKIEILLQKRQKNSFME